MSTPPKPSAHSPGKPSAHPTAPPAAVHFRFEDLPPQMRGFVRLILLFLAGFCGLMYWTNVILFGPVNSGSAGNSGSFTDPFYAYAVFKSAGVVVAILAVTYFWPDLRERHVVLLRHKESGAWLWLRIYRRNKLIGHAQFSRITHVVIKDEPLVDHDSNPYTEHRLWAHFQHRPKRDLIKTNLPTMNVLLFLMRDLLAQEINRQQDGSWRTQPLILTDDLDHAELDVDPGWDETAATTPAADHAEANDDAANAAATNPVSSNGVPQ